MPLPKILYKFFYKQYLAIFDLLYKMLYNVFMIDYRYSEDIHLIREMLGLSQDELALAINSTQISVTRWEDDLDTPYRFNAEAIYSLAYKNGIELNKVRVGFLKDRYSPLLFHGSIQGIEGELSFSHANPRADFGIGFYLGESLEQAGSWVCDGERASVYCFGIDTKRLKKLDFSADLRWVLCICAYRGYLEEKSSHPLIQSLMSSVEDADFIYAPIADNVMYATIQDFALGYITDEQCSHALSANQLGMQYVFKSQKGLSLLCPLARLYLCEEEKRYYAKIREGNEKDGESKNKDARIAFRGKGRYIDEILS